MDFSFYVYNEYIILYCCGLEHDTRKAIFKRSIEGDENISGEEYIDNEDENSTNSSNRTRFLTTKRLKIYKGIY